MDIVSDRDFKFTSDFWSQVFKKLETNLSISCIDHPQSDGQTERLNQIIEDMLRTYMAKNSNKWEQYLLLLEFAYNSSRHTSTQYSPFSHEPQSMLILIEMNLTAHKIFLEIYKKCCI
jgi:hypothetical protein